MDHRGGRGERMMQYFAQSGGYAPRRALLTYHQRLHGHNSAHSRPLPPLTCVHVHMCALCSFASMASTRFRYLNARHLRGGINAYSEEADASVPQYLESDGDCTTCNEH